MHSVKILVFAAGLLLACTASPTFADSPVHAPDSAGLADTSSSARVEEPLRQSLSLAQPWSSTEALALLRTQVGSRAVRVSVGEDDDKLSHARRITMEPADMPALMTNKNAWDGSRPAPGALR